MSAEDKDERQWEALADALVSFSVEQQQKPRQLCPLPPLGTGGRDRAGVIYVFEGDPTPTPRGPGYTQVVVVSRAAPRDTAGGSDAINKPAMAFDAMPPKLAREDPIKTNGQYHRIYERYLRGELPPWANQEFEQIMRQLSSELDALDAQILAGRNGRRNTVRKNCLDKIRDAYKHDDSWPGGLTSQEWADLWGFDLRTFERAKREFIEVLAGCATPK
jgi:hypothetical protein